MIRDLFNLLFPATCYGCGQVLVGDEHYLCTQCLLHLPYTHFASLENNATEQRLSQYLPIESATSLLFFSHDSSTRGLVHSIKYHGNTRMAHLFGKQLGEELAASHRFDGVDMIVPVPLHWLRRMRRGYNQSQLLCQGIAEVFSKPVVTGNLIRHRYTHPQALKNRADRKRDIQFAFSVRNPKAFENKHILIVDDVITTGATIGACISTLQKISGVRVSVASLSLTQ